MNITVATKLYGVIGDPIRQSLSPILHNKLFKTYQIDGLYFPIPVQSDDLDPLIKGFRLLNFAGFNITKPHKETIMPFLDQIDPLAAKIGAVNTVVCQKGQMIGYNTDGYGFIQSLKGHCQNKEALTVLILGSGGAVKSVSMALADWGIKKIILANRTLEKAQKLCHQINENWPQKAQAIALNPVSLKDACAEAAIIVNGTSLGMGDTIDQSPLDPAFFKAGTLVYDMIYNPSQTRFLKEAKEKGTLTQNGLDMLLYQGLLAFEHWTGIMPDASLGKQILEKGLTHEKSNDS